MYEESPVAKRHCTIEPLDVNITTWCNKEGAGYTLQSINKAGGFSFVSYHSLPTQADTSATEEYTVRLSTMEGSLTTTRESTTSSEGSSSPNTSNEVTKQIECVETRPICKFYVEGKCRFGEACMNLHEGEVKVIKNKKKDKTKKPEEEKAAGKKPSMKTARDVIKRIKWDSDLPEVCISTF